ncbi:serine hydrolase domain-containing protein [Nonomuraea sp. LP-02]|uniref:serine hydrolase domain-containing protein n=1 Tax=Nonomuraea sp. LP-02 TaxID=3097960 RepID=UPI002E32A8FB|nr:serine hydrolase domain-containing protein [Nonomuraea sp. LP-02]MED7928048.1 serine hydrolase domain-containing protein [Nonomuraea sp. LP-02]
MSLTLALTDQDQLTLRTAAWGAVSLMSAAGAAGSAHKAAAEGSVALTSATGLVGHVLAKALKGVKYGKTVAELADQVLPALNASMSLLRQQAPAEADNFRRTVLVAVEAATRGRPSPTMTEMARKISAALDAAPATPEVGAANTVAGQDRPELQKAMQAFVDSGIATGMQLRVNDERGEWVGTAGVRELGSSEKPPADGRFRIGSSTKTFVATVVLQLAAEGKVGLDSPVDGYLPEFALDERITVRMLLQHTSGIFNHTGEYYEDGTFAPGIAWSGKEWVDGRFRTYHPEELVRLALSKPARFEPGTDWSYSNTNYVLARLLIERVTGRSFAEELQRLILGPLGMTGTEAPGTSTEIAGPHAHSYYRYEDGGREHTVDVTSQNPSWISAGGDMISTTEDLHTFFSALNGGRLLPTELLTEMRRPDPKIGYGLGIFKQDLGENGGTIYHHNGGMAGSAALMYSTPDGGRTLTASVTYVDDAALSKAAAFQQATQQLIDEVFRDGRTTS